MKAYGMFIDREIEIEAKEDGVAIIPHKVLEKLSNEFDVFYTFESIFNNGAVAVFKCSASCETINRRAEAIGEASNKNLENEISKRYPSVMASKRAFDRAMIRLFGFDETYSDNEIEEKSTKTDPAVTPAKTAPAIPIAASTKKIPETPVKEAIEQPLVEQNLEQPIVEKVEAPVVETSASHEETQPIISEPVPEITTVEKSIEDTLGVVEEDDGYEENFVIDDYSDNASNENESAKVVATEDTVEETPEVKVPTKTIEPEEAPEPFVEEEPEFLSIVVAFGQYKARNMTMKQLYIDHRSSLDWLANGIPYSSELAVAQTQAAKDTIAYMEARA